jgi:RNA polymerase sigma-70 factor (ECF subfamily)
MSGAGAVSLSLDTPVVLDVASSYVEHAAFIARVIARLCGDGPHVDDLLQETFVIAFRRRADYDGRAGARTWLYSIAAHLCLRHKRSTRRFALFRGRFGAEPPPCAPTACGESQLERKQDLALALAVLQRLSFEQREVFVLYELEELAGAEIATLLDIPIGTVWTRLSAARKKFTVLLRKRRAQEGVS